MSASQALLERIKLSSDNSASRNDFPQSDFYIAEKKNEQPNELHETFPDTVLRDALQPSGNTTIDDSNYFESMDIHSPNLGDEVYNPPRARGQQPRVRHVDLLQRIKRSEQRAVEDIAIQKQRDMEKQIEQRGSRYVSLILGGVVGFLVVWATVKGYHFFKGLFLFLTEGCPDCISPAAKAAVHLAQ